MPPNRSSSSPGPWLLAGLALAVAIASFFKSPPPPPAPAVPEAADDGEALRLAEELRRTLTSLERRVEDLERESFRARTDVAPSPATAPATATSAPPMDRLLALEARVEQLSRAPSVEPEQLRALIREEAVAARGPRDLRSREQTEAFVSRFAEQQRLTLQQAENVQRILLEEETRRMALIERMRGQGRDRREFRRELSNLQEQTARELGQHLNKDQLHQLQEQRNQQQRRRGGRF